MNQLFLKNEEGFTLQELTVVIVVSSLLFIFSTISYGFVQRTYHLWMERILERDMQTHSIDQVRHDLRLSKDIISITDSTVVLLMVNNDTVTYFASNEELIRNNVAMFTADSLHLALKTFYEHSISRSRRRIRMELSFKDQTYRTIQITAEDLRAEKQKFLEESSSNDETIR